MRTQAVSCGFFVLVLGLAGCAQEAVSGCNMMDIVFVVDNSGSMDQEQALLVRSFFKMIDVLSRHKVHAAS